MNSSLPKQAATFFAPAQRADLEELRETQRLVNENPLFNVVRDVVDGYLLILNAQRQILAANEEFLRLLKLPEPGDLVGYRFGEALRCSHAEEGPNGCGTSKACPSCGSVLAILASIQEGRPSWGECSVNMRSNGACDSREFRVRANPIDLNNRRFTILVFQDISALKRKEALERVFFHDILNTVTGLAGWSALLKEFKEQAPPKAAEQIFALSRQLARDIKDQSRLRKAEDGSLALDIHKTPVERIFEELNAVFEVESIQTQKKLVFEADVPKDMVVTDVSLLERVLINMIKNAFEAVGPGADIRVRHERIGDGHLFSVHNPGRIPESVALRILERSFSTKSDKGRGVGTYSMRLFGEKYLKGKVGFSTGEDGTTFRIELPNLEPGDV
jgi:signal transduction histidine kinase